MILTVSSLFTGTVIFILHDKIQRLKEDLLPKNIVLVTTNNNETRRKFSIAIIVFYLERMCLVSKKVPEVVILKTWSTI